MTCNKRVKVKRQDRYVKNIYGAICMAASLCAVYGVWQMAKACPEHAATVAACVAVLALARGDLLIRFGPRRRRESDPQ